MSKYQIAFIFQFFPTMYETAKETFTSFQVKLLPVCNMPNHALKDRSIPLSALPKNTSELVGLASTLFV